jgi:LacI family transcriptional regulator
MTDTPRVSARVKSSPTIYDVAEAAGVSASTVSRALNKPGRINPKTEQRIREIAGALGYQLNPMARAVITGRTGNVALLLSDITNPVYFDVIRGAELVAAANERTLVLAESQESAEKENALAQRLRVSVDGIVLVGSRMSDEQIRTLAGVKPVVVVNRVVESVAGVVAEPEAGLVDALDHLHELGHRSVAYLSGPATSWMNEHRWRILFSNAVARGMSIVEVPAPSPTLDGGRRSLGRLLASGVTAVIAYNDLLAMGLLAAGKDEGVPIPGRLSVVGFDDIFGAGLLTPALTTIRSPLSEVGHRAMSILIAEDPSSSGLERLPVQFVPRASTDAPAAS